MATSAYKGSQTLLQIGNAASPEVFTTIGEVRSIGTLGVKNDLLEVTHLLSTVKEYIGGLPEGVEFDVTCNYLPDSASQRTMITKVSAGTASNFKYVIPSTASGGTKTIDFSALVLGWNLPTTSPNEPQQITYNLKISGTMAGNAIT